MVSRRFIKSSLMYTIAGALPMASAVLLLFFYTQDLSTALYGKYAIFLSFALLIQILVTYSFDSSIYVHYHEFKGDHEKLSTFISSAFVLMLSIGIGVAIFFSLAGQFIFELLIPERNISFFPFGVMSLATGILQGVFKVYTSLLQTRQEPEKFFWSNVLLFGLIAIFTIGGLKIFPQSMVGPIGGRLVAYLFAGGWVLWTVFREFGIRIDLGWLKSSLGFNNYTFIYQIEQWIINYFDRIVMSFFLPLAMVGIYDFALRCLVVVELVMNGLHNSFYPKVISTLVTEKHKISVPEINRYYHGLIGSVMILVTLCIISFPFAIKWFANKDSYTQSIKLIPYLAVLYLPRVVKIYFSAPYGALKFTKPLPVIYLVVSIIKIGLMMILIKRFEISGVIFAGAIAAFAEIVLLRYGLGEKFVFRFNPLKILFSPLILFLFIVCFEPFVLVDYPVLKHCIYFLFCALILSGLYKNEIITIVKGLIKMIR